MVAQSLCPDPDVIHDLLCGELPESAHDELALHFEVCPECRQLFDAEASGPEFLGDAARQTTTNAWERETAALQQLVQDLPGQLSQASDAAAMTQWSSESISEFLEPSDNDEHLGRLGAYELVEVIGRGGMGVVLRGLDEKLNRTVAVKMLAPEWAANANARRRFFREAQAAAAVSHDHVVTIHAVDDSARLPYLVMEFVQGESLEECVRRTGSLDVEATLRMGRQMALGLAAAHEVGLVHRDMKPANILLENGIQKVRITDFGLARAVDDVGMTQTGTVTGTPLYMSPEQASGEPVDHRSDLFSLGSILYTMCTGRPAFRAKTTLAVLKRVCEDTPRPIREVNPDCPQWLAEIIDRLMTRHPEDRLQSASDVAELLGGHLAHLQDPQQAAPPSVATSRQESSKKPKTFLKPLLFALLLLVSVIGITEAAGVTHIAEYLGIILRVETKDGTLLVEIEDPNVTVSVDDGEVVVEGAGVKEIRLKPGKHKWTTNRNGVPASTQWVTIERGGKKVLRVKQLPPGTQTASTTIPETPKPEDTERVAFGPIGEPETITIGKPGEELTRLTSYEGVVFELPQHIRRFYSGQHVHGPSGEHVFDEVPEQLWGQRCTSGYRDGGQMKFSVHTTRRSGRQRLWLLVCVSDWEKGDGYESPASMQDKGWAAWRSITSSPITDRERKKKTEWAIFYRDAKPGETHTIVTHPRRTPLLVWGSIDLDGLLCEAHWDQRVGTFGPGASIALGNGHHIFDGPIPEDLIGRRYAKRNGYLGISNFRVQRDQNVVIGVYDWKHTNDGSGGDWQKELTSPPDLAKNGWKEIAQLKGTHSNGNPEYSKIWHFYSRDCKAGETFALRSHKYQAPIVLADLSRGRQGPAPEPSPIIDSFPPKLDLLQISPETIRLDSSKIELQLGPQLGKAGIIGFSTSTMQKFPLLFGTAVRNRKDIPKSHKALVGQLTGLTPNTTVTVATATRKANRIQIVFLQNPPIPAIGAETIADTLRPPGNLFFRWNLPLLPPGEYHVEALIIPDPASLGKVEGPPPVLSSTTGMVIVSGSDFVPGLLKQMASKAILIRSAKEPDLGRPQTQATTGFDLAELVAHSKQHAALKAFPQDHSKWEAACERFRAEGKQWALCELLNWDNVDRKIYAARALAKLASADTVSVLLAAAKRNSYSIDGSESATLHSIYRIALKKALESATKLKVSPDVADRRLRLPEDVDFKRIENWLRNVYLADASEDALALASVPQGTVEPGLIGRATGDGKDTGVIFRYPHARVFHRDQIPLEVYDHNRFQISLEGFLEVPRDMTVKVWLAGGGVSHDVNWLYVDGKEIGSTGDNRGKNYNYELPLLKGRHQVKWLLTGGTFRSNILVFLDPQSGQLLPLKNRGIASVRRKKDEPLIEINGKDMGWPIRDNWLPDVVYKLAGKENNKTPDPPSKGGF